MKIIKKGLLNNIMKCDYCECEYEYETCEIKNQINTFYGQFGDIKKYVTKYVCCPCCNSKNYIKLKEK